MMKKETWKLTFGISLLTATLLVGCGGTATNSDKGNGRGNQGSGMGGQGNGSSEGEGSNIPYLKQNHANYKEHGSNMTPAPTKDANAKSINWTITATTEEGAIKLQEHLAFMEDKLNTDKNPRAWDKLFLMEAYMKYNNHYTTSVDRSGTNVIVSKQASTACAYEVISAHSDVVKGDFFTQGNIEIDHSSEAEKILAKDACSAVRTEVTSYIRDRQKTRGH